VAAYIISCTHHHHRERSMSTGGSSSNNNDEAAAPAVPNISAPAPLGISENTVGNRNTVTPELNTLISLWRRKTVRRR